MKEIKLTQNKVALVDDDMFEELNKYTWCATRSINSKNTFYAKRNKHGGRKVRKGIHMHRVILNTPDGMETDHIDGNGLNNQRYNLRPCTRQQNNANRKPYPDMSSEFKGVNWRKDRDKWRAYIKMDRKYIHLGHFDSETDAAHAYDAKAIELFGQFARPNFKAELPAQPLKPGGV